MLGECDGTDVVTVLLDRYHSRAHPMHLGNHCQVLLSINRGLQLPEQVSLHKLVYRDLEKV